MAVDYWLWGNGDFIELGDGTGRWILGSSVDVIEPDVPDVPSTGGHWNQRPNRGPFPVHRPVLLPDFIGRGSLRLEPLQCSGVGIYSETELREQELLILLMAAS